jgi:hypothetical protein
MVSPVHTMKVYSGVEIYFHAVLTSTKEEVEWSVSLQLHNFTRIFSNIHKRLAPKKSRVKQISNLVFTNKNNYLGVSVNV